MNLTVQLATSNPAALPTNDSTMLSASNWRTIRQRPAPRAERIANSRRRTPLGQHRLRKTQSRAHLGVRVVYELARNRIDFCAGLPNRNAWLATSEQLEITRGIVLISSAKCEWRPQISFRKQPEISRHYPDHCVRLAVQR